METDATKRIWEFTKHTLTDKLLFLALAQFANSEGTCYPSYDTLAGMVGVNRRSAIRIVEKLAQSGELFYKPSVGRGNTNLYFVVVGLSSGEVKQVLTTAYEMTPDEAKAVADSLVEKGVISDINSVTDDTFSKPEIVLPITPKAPKGVTHNTRSKESFNKESIPSLESNKVLSPKQKMFLALAELCRVNLKVATDKQLGQLGQSSDVLLKMVTDIDQFKDEFGLYWIQVDWRGKRGDSPTPAQIREAYGDYCHWLENHGQPKNGNHKASVAIPVDPRAAAISAAFSAKSRG